MEETKSSGGLSLVNKSKRGYAEECEGQPQGGASLMTKLEEEPSLTDGEWTRCLLRGDIESGMGQLRQHVERRGSGRQDS